MNIRHNINISFDILCVQFFDIIISGDYKGIFPKILLKAII